MDPTEQISGDAQKCIEDTTMKDFIKAVQNCGSSFCVGGHILVQPDPQPLLQSQAPTSAVPPVTLRWDVPNHPPNALTIKFPLLDSQSEIFKEVLKACEPATFGLGDKDVLNEEYRKAGKLDNTQFSVSLHPSDYGIIDTIAQTLLPSLVGKDRRADHRGVLAELYKMNSFKVNVFIKVYSGPGGKFKAHVDTPRSSSQFGSLVICLPSPFIGRNALLPKISFQFLFFMADPSKMSGGNLRISHNGTTNYFNWSTLSPSSIQWAAFYSDCEHEIYEVLEGHRITLTYNLYFTSRVDATLQAFPATSPQIFPLFKVAQAMLQNPNFLPNGGTLGFHCVHAYPHANEDTNDLMPYALKGMDCIVFSVFRELGLRPVARPVMEDFPEYEDSQSDEEAPIGHGFHETVVDEYEVEGSFEECQRLRNVWPLEQYTVHWINDTSRNTQLAFVGLAHGNQAELWYKYSSAAIFIEIPVMTPDKRGGVFARLWAAS
ncbi:hypothetical protein HYFRA_00007222 [Hymenoscyphus fraxineus]|uniref:Fe2OG dioxygenase domain-containing protein n=1 Tax=Hymenoscyphus fraxineus TaxID=746836 RepID=A0A9N9PPZ6_9HELO|nr:hypothetical protein HYFRA_00007222 [Hymenoscyphus fraxineus]